MANARRGLALFQHVRPTSPDPVSPVGWIVFGGPFFLACSLTNLNPLDFFVWGHLSYFVYETPIQAENDLSMLQAECEMPDSSHTFSVTFAQLKFSPLIALRTFNHVLKSLFSKKALSTVPCYLRQDITDRAYCAPVSDSSSRRLFFCLYLGDKASQTTGNNFSAFSLNPSGGPTNLSVEFKYILHMCLCLLTSLMSPDSHSLVFIRPLNFHPFLCPFHPSESWSSCLRRLEGLCGPSATAIL